MGFEGWKKKIRRGDDRSEESKPEPFSLHPNSSRCKLNYTETRDLGSARHDSAFLPFETRYLLTDNG